MMPPHALAQLMIAIWNYAVLPGRLGHAAPSGITMLDAPPPHTEANAITCGTVVAANLLWEAAARMAAFTPMIPSLVRHQPDESSAVRCWRLVPDPPQ